MGLFLLFYVYSPSRLDRVDGHHCPTTIHRDMRALRHE